MECIFCNQEITDDSRFCDKCGKMVPRCPTCGKVVTRRIRFCGEDGTAIPEEVLALLPDGTERPVLQEAEQLKPVQISVAVETREQSGPAAGPVQAEASVQPASGKKRGGLVLLILLFILAALAVGAGLGYAAAEGKLSFPAFQADSRNGEKSLEEEPVAPGEPVDVPGTEEPSRAPEEMQDSGQEERGQTWGNW